MQLQFDLAQLSQPQSLSRLRAGNYGIAGGNPGSGNAANIGNYGAR